MIINELNMLLVSQIALLDNVTQNLRALTIDADANTIYTNFYFDGEIQEEDYEASECILDHIIASFLHSKKDELINFASEKIKCDFPKKMNLQGYLVYLRKENTNYNYEKKINKNISNLSIMNLKLVAQEALLGNVTKYLRAMTIDLVKDTILINFFYDGDNKDQDAINSVINHFKLCFSKDNSTKISTTVLRCDSPNVMPLNKNIVFLRRNED